MSTDAQVAANRANAKLSCGPTTATGKASSAKNNFRHGLAGPFSVLPWEKEEDYQALEQDLLAEHQPSSTTESILVREMAQSHWLRQRAIVLQNTCFNLDDPATDDPKQLALYLRYQSTHGRAFYKALNELQKLREQKRKLEIGFVSQKRREEQEALKETRRQALETRREASENRAQELHQVRVWLTEAITRRHETETTIARFEKLPRDHQMNAA